MTTWDSFYPYLLPRVPGCPYPTADNELRIAAQEWCDKTLCWRTWLADVTTTINQNTYSFGLSSGQDLVQLLRSTLDGLEIDVLTADSIPANWQTDTSWCDQRGIFTTDATNFVLVPMPDAGLIVQNEVVLRPSNTATGVENSIFAAYASEIATGAAARLHAMPGWTFSYPESKARAEFLAAIDAAASDVWYGTSRAPHRVRARFL